MGDLFNLKELRESKGMTQEKLAKKVGVTRQYIGTLEGQGATPSVEVAKKIAKVLGFNWTKFYEDETELATNE